MGEFNHSYSTESQIFVAYMHRKFYLLTPLALRRLRSLKNFHLPQQEANKYNVHMISVFRSPLLPSKGERLNFGQKSLEIFIFTLAAILKFSAIYNDEKITEGSDFSHKVIGTV